MKFFLNTAIFLLIGSVESMLTMQHIIRGINENEDALDGRNLPIDKILQSATPCECIEKECSCGFTYIGGNPSSVDLGKLIMKFDDSNGLFASLTAGNSENHISVRDFAFGVELPPLCVPVPHLPGSRFCAVFYDVGLNQEIGFHICASVEQQLFTTTLGEISFDCINVSQNAINIVEPNQQRPSLVDIHVGKSPKITLFNTISIAALPPFAAPPIIAGGGVSD